MQAACKRSGINVGRSSQLRNATLQGIYGVIPAGGFSMPVTVTVERRSLAALLPAPALQRPKAAAAGVSLTRQQRRKQERMSSRSRGPTQVGWVISDPLEFMVPLAAMAADEGRPNPFGEHGMDPSRWNEGALMAAIAAEMGRALGTEINHEKVSPRDLPSLRTP